MLSLYAYAGFGCLLVLIAGHKLPKASTLELLEVVLLGPVSIAWATVQAFYEVARDPFGDAKKDG
jgi:hypothetical protein